MIIERSDAVYVHRGWPKRVLVILVGLLAWYGTQYFIGSRMLPIGNTLNSASAVLTSGDSLLRLTERIHSFFSIHLLWTNVLLIVSSACIDFLGIVIFFRSIRGPSLRPFIGLCILFGLRQMVQFLVFLPPPVGMIWHNPGVPSLLVTYGVSNDLFFSGHTALAVYGAIELARSKKTSALYLGACVVCLEIATVIVLRAHYTMDVFTGIIAAMLASFVAEKISPYIDSKFMGNTKKF